MEAPNTGIDLREAYQTKATETIRKFCQINGFDNPVIDIGHDTLAADNRPSTLFINVLPDSGLPEIELIINSDGTVSYNLRTEHVGQASVSTSRMAEYVDLLGFCNSLASEIETIYKTPMTVDGDGHSHAWRSGDLDMLDETGGVKNVEYVRQVAETILEACLHRKARS